MDKIIITNEPLHSELFRREYVPCSCCGAHLWFEGVVRDENVGKSVNEIYYEGYSSMAEKELKEIVKAMRAQWPLHTVMVAHRLGKVKVREISLLILITAAHRQEAFDAMQFLIREIKKKVPVWKKEEYANQTAQWL